MRFISAILSLYMVLIFIRILLSWFSGPSSEGRSVQLLHKATDPYLAWFRRFTFLQRGRIDFTPIAAIITLGVVLNITNTLAVRAEISVGIVLALIVGAVGSAFFFIVGFFLLLTIARVVSVFFGASSVHPFWQTIDTIINPVLAFLQKTFLRNREMTYRSGLVVSAVILLVIFFLGRFLLARLVALISSLPI